MGFAVSFMGGLTVIVFAIVLIVLLATKGDAGENQYGPDPKGTDGFSSNELLDN